MLKQATMKQARIYVDFNEMIGDDLVHLSENDIITDSKGTDIELKVGMKVKIYDDDLSSCNDKDNLIADGIVEKNNNGGWEQDIKWNCRINKKGIYNESQKRK